MEERVEDVLRKYDLEIQHAYRVRGAYVLETGQGIYLYKSYGGSETRAGCEAAIQECLMERGFPMVDQYLRNEEGNYLTLDVMGEAHVVKRWYLGEECNLRERADICLAAETLAGLHRAMKHMKEDLPFEVKVHAVPMEEAEVKHLREMQRVKSYIRNKKERNLFEVKYLQYAEQVYGQGQEALTFLAEQRPEELEKKAAEDGDFCHGSYTYHNLIIGRGGTAVVQYDRSWAGLQLMDLYYLLRKTLEKNEWEPQTAEWIMNGYQKTLALGEQERRVLYGLLWFPDKFWKIANAYYNSKKSRIPGRNLVKLTEFIRQSEARERFLQESRGRIF